MSKKIKDDRPKEEVRVAGGLVVIRFHVREMSIEEFLAEWKTIISSRRH